MSVKFNLSRNVEYLDDEDNTMLVSLIVTVFEDAEKNNYPFSLKSNMTGIFKLDNIHELER